MTRRQPRRVHPGDLVLKIYGGSFGHDSRDLRELKTVRELGLRAIVLAKGRDTDKTDALGWEWKIVTTRPLGEAGSLEHLNRALSLALWAREARRLRPAVISGHDLIGTFVGWLSTLFVASSRRPLLIYDAHEFTVGLHTGWRRRVISALEGFLMRRCALSIAVNDSIADRMRDLHRGVARPVVVRSMPERWSVDRELVAAHRRQFLDRLGADEDTFLLMYHGAVSRGRGVESLVQVLQGRPDVALVVLGAGDPRYLGELKRLAERSAVSERVLFLEPVSLARLGEYVGAADAGMVTVPRSSDSYYLMLPNKFFENIQAGTPVIASDFPEVGAIVRRYDIGLLVDPSDVAEIGRAVDRLRDDPALGARLRANVRLARQELCWENEQRRLVEAYAGLMV